MAGKGHPRAFEDAGTFMDAFKEYIKYCDEGKRFPNIAGFCTRCGISRETFYAQKKYYSDTFNKIDAALEDEALQFSDYRAGLYLKNKFGYKEKAELSSDDEKPFSVKIKIVD